MSDRTQTYLFGLWTLIDEILNSVLFLLIGLEVLVISLHRSLAHAGSVGDPDRSCRPAYCHHCPAACVFVERDHVVAQRARSSPGRACGAASRSRWPCRSRIAGPSQHPCRHLRGRAVQHRRAGAHPWMGGEEDKSDCATRRVISAKKMLANLVVREGRSTKLTGAVGGAGWAQLMAYGVSSMPAWWPFTRPLRRRIRGGGGFSRAAAITRHGSESVGIGRTRR